MALLIALGGTSYAALRLPPNTVGTSQLRDHAVTAGKVAARAVTTDAIRNGAVTRAKLGSRAITASAIPVGAGVGLTYKYGSVRVAPGQQLPAYVTCPPGNTVVGGGVTADNAAVVVNDSAPFDSKSQAWTGRVSDSWGVYVTNTSTDQSSVTGVYAVCIVATKVH